MKTRNGWVSNSSSSSFVIIGKEVSLQEVIDGKYPKDLYLFGWNGCEGTEMIEINNAYRKAIIESGRQDEEIDGRFYHVIESGESIDLGVIRDKLNGLSDDYKIFGERIDDHSPESISDFIESYLSE